MSIPTAIQSSKFSQWFYRHPRVLLVALLSLPLLWLGVIYLGSLFALLIQSFFSIDEFSGLIIYELTLDSYRQLFTAANGDVILRTVVMALCVTIAASIIAFPIAYTAARFAKGAWRAVFYIGVMLPLWSSFMVKIYAWKLILAKEGIFTWLMELLHLTSILDALLSLPVIGGYSLSVSYIGTFLVFVYIWLPFMILPIQSSLERVPSSVLEASSDLGASPLLTLRYVILPLAMPGVIAGSIFTFSLTLGDYIIPSIIGSSRPFIGQVVYMQQGTAGNMPMAAVFAVIPILVMIIYLQIARRTGAFNAL